MFASEPREGDSDSFFAKMRKATSGEGNKFAYVSFVAERDGAKKVGATPEQIV